MIHASIPFEPGSSVVAYLRDSGGDDQELSVSQQSEKIREWTDQNHLILSQIFADEAAPGSSTIGRDAFMRMINHFHNSDNHDNGIILWKYSRFSRDIDDAQFYKADLRRRGAVIFSMNDNIPDGNDGRIYEALIDWMNARYLEDLSLDVRRGLQHLVKEYGAVPGTPPRGFKREIQKIGLHRDGTPHNISRWVPDPDWWERCKKAFQMKAERVSIREIHRQLHLFGALSSYSTFFTNRLYIGELKYGDIVIPDYAEPLVSQEIWNAVQQMHRTNSKEYNPMSGPENSDHPRRAGSSFLLSGLLHCPRCGALMNGTVIPCKNGKRLKYYQCANARMRKCDARLIPKETIENMVIQNLREYVLDPELIAERDREFSLDSAGNHDALEDELKRAERDSQNIQRKISNITSVIADEADPSRSLMTMLHDLEDQETMKTAEIERIKSSMNKEKVFIGSPEKYARLSEAALTELTSHDPQRTKRILHSLINRIVAERDGKIIRGMTYFYNPEPGDINPDLEQFRSTTMSHRGDAFHRPKIYCIEIARAVEPRAP